MSTGRTLWSAKQPSPTSPSWMQVNINGRTAQSGALASPGLCDVSYSIEGYLYMLFSDGFAFSRTAARCQSLLKTEESTHIVDVDARQLTRGTASRHLHAALNGRLRTRHKMIGQENLQSAFCKTAKTPDDINSQVIAAISIQSSSSQSTYQITLLTGGLLGWLRVKNL